MWKQIRKGTSSEIGSWPVPSKKKKEITGRTTRRCCGLNNERTGRGFPSPLIIDYRQHGDENVVDTKTSGAAPPGSLRGRKNEACVA